MWSFCFGLNVVILVLIIPHHLILVVKKVTFLELGERPTKVITDSIDAAEKKWY